jgi:hypothetical protein
MFTLQLVQFERHERRSFYAGADLYASTRAPWLAGMARGEIEFASNAYLAAEAAFDGAIQHASVGSAPYIIALYRLAWCVRMRNDEATAHQLLIAALLLARRARGQQGIEGLEDYARRSVCAP